MRLGLSTAAFYGRWETEEAARYISTLPLDCAEVFLQTGSEYALDFAAQVRANLGTVRCTSVHPNGFQFENQMFGRSVRQRKDAFDVFYRALDAAQRLGASYYVYHGRSTPQLAPLPFNLQMNVDMMGQMGEAAAQRDLVIAWENVYWCQLTSVERIMQVKAALPDVRFTLDIKQAMRAGEDAMEMACAMGKGLVNVHVSDWTQAGKLCLPGEGSFDFDGLFAVLREIGYDGPVILEPYLAQIRDEAALLRALSWLRARMREAGI